MAKGQKHGNREAKKPKQVKLAAPAAAGDGLFARSNLSVSTATKKRT